ncbi:exported hypothetical protein [Verrucomicrobia bacterium]|nr:exported hypothetical protein [Verrucomicrobiota bacterium]
MGSRFVERRPCSGGKFYFGHITQDLASVAPAACVCAPAPPFFGLALQPTDRKANPKNRELIIFGSVTQGF